LITCRERGKNTRLRREFPLRQRVAELRKAPLTSRVNRETPTTRFGAWQELLDLAFALLSSEERILWSERSAAASTNRAPDLAHTDNQPPSSARGRTPYPPAPPT
jgi:hypothetical protein